MREAELAQRIQTLRTQQRAQQVWTQLHPQLLLAFALSCGLEQLRKGTPCAADEICASTHVSFKHHYHLSD